jgi:putative toxin-antitoxin system antitoxin component (TIGR02293 family)
MPSKVQTKTAPAQRKTLEQTVYFRLGSLLEIDPISSEGEIANIVERRLSTRALDALKRAGFTDKAVHELIIPRRTLEHRREQRKSLLTEEESDKVVRLARIIVLARSVFGDIDKAWAWLCDADQFRGKDALAKASTSAGARQVEERLYQIYYGIFG